GGTGPTANIDWTSMITSDAGWAIHSPAGEGTWSDLFIKWSSSGAYGGRHFNMPFQTAPGMTSLNANDKFILIRAEFAQVPGGLSADTPYHPVNISGANFDLAATPNGTPINPTNSNASGEQFWYLPTAASVTPGSISNWSSARGQAGYVANSNGSRKWARKLIGGTLFNSKIADSEAHLVAGRTTFTTYPKYRMQT